jgi:hypothetical protein
VDASKYSSLPGEPTSVKVKVKLVSNRQTQLTLALSLEAALPGFTAFLSEARRTTANVFILVSS